MESAIKTRRLLLLMTTASYRANAFLEAARHIGVQVVIGSERQQALAVANPAGHLTLEFLAPEIAVRTIADFNKRYPINTVIAADDDGVVISAMAANALGLPHNPIEAVAAARNKFLTREVFAKTVVSSPRYAKFSVTENPEEIARHISFPCVIKPLSLSASRGVIRADDATQFAAAFIRVAAILRQPEVAGTAGDSSQHILVESFIPGKEVAVEGLLSKGQLKVLAIFDKPDPLDGPFFEETIYVTPSRHPESVQREIIDCTAKAVKALGLCDGPVHAELRINDQGAWILEIAPRSIGGLCSRTLRFGEGISLEEMILRHALGLEVSAFEREHLAAGVIMIPIPCVGILREVRGIQEAKEVAGIEDIRITIPIGQTLVPLPEGKKYLGFIFARDESPVGVEAALREAHRRLSFVIDSSGN